MSAEGTRPKIWGDYKITSIRFFLYDLFRRVGDGQQGFYHDHLVPLLVPACFRDKLGSELSNIHSKTALIPFLSTPATTSAKRNGNMQFTLGC